MQDRGTFHDFTQGPCEQTNNPLDVAIDGDGFLVVQTAGGERYTRDGGLQINNPASWSPPPAIRCSAPPARSCSSRPTMTSTSRPTAPSPWWKAPAEPTSIRGKLRLVSFADAQKLLKDGANLYAAGEGGAPQADTKSQVRQGFIEKSNVNSVAEMSRMIEMTRAYTQISTLLQQQSDLQKTAIEKLADVPA